MGEEVRVGVHVCLCDYLYSPLIFGQLQSKFERGRKISKERNPAKTPTQKTTVSFALLEHG